MTVTADALDMLAGDPPRYPHVPGDFRRHPETGAPYVAHPTETTKDGKPRRVMYGRPSSFGSALDNPFNLVKWKERQLVLGLWLLEHGDGDILSDDDLPDTYRDSLIARAYEAAGTSLAADRGTHIHRLLEHHDKGDLGFHAHLIADGEELGIPEALQYQIIDQWNNFRIRTGLTALAVEQTVVNDRWRLAGTLDRLDIADHDILTAYGVLEAGQPFVGDIKTGGVTVGSDGQPNYWVKYPIQLAAYVDAVPYDTETDERGGFGFGDNAKPDPHIALIYHYDLARALDGEPVDWVAIPVNVDAGREGGDLCRAAADFGKRRDLFAMPAPTKIAEPRQDSWDVIWNALGTVVDPIPDELQRAVRLLERDGYLGPEAQQLCAPFIAVPAPLVAVEQTATDPEPDTASPPVPGRAADPEHLRRRVKDLVDAGHEKVMRRHWPVGVPTLKHGPHSYEQRCQILDAVRKVEAEVGAPFHPDDSPPPQSRDAARRALAAWGNDINGAWFAASIIATFEQCRLPDCTLEGLVGQFSLEQCERLWEAAPNLPQTH